MYTTLHKRHTERIHKSTDSETSDLTGAFATKKYRSAVALTLEEVLFVVLVLA